MSGYTKGPWAWDSYGDVVARVGRTEVDVITADEYHRIRVTPCDARLIAAAPDLLEALKAAISDFDAWAHENENEPRAPVMAWVEKARNAVNKAEAQS